MAILSRFSHIFNFRNDGVGSVHDLAMILDFLYYPVKPSTTPNNESISYESINKESLVLLKTGHLMAVFELTGVDPEFLQPGTNPVYNQVFDFFKHIDQTSVFEFYFARNIAHSPLFEHPIMENVNHRRMAFWKSRSKTSFEETLIMTVSFDLDLKKRKTTDISRLKKIIHSRLGKIFERISAARNFLKKFGCRLLDQSECAHYLYYITNNEWPRLPFGEFIGAGTTGEGELPVRGLSDFIFDGRQGISFVQGKNYFIFGERYVTAISVDRFPRELFDIFWKPLFEFNGEIMIKKVIKRLDFKKLMSGKQMDIQVSQAVSKLNSQHVEFTSQVEELTNSVELEGNGVYHAKFQFFVFSSSLETMLTARSKIMVMLQQLGLSVLFESERGVQLSALNLFPGNGAFTVKDIPRLMTTDNLAETAMVYRGFGGSLRYFDVLANTSGGLFFLNTLRYRVNHMTITGPSGTGKSFLAVRMLFSVLKENPLLFVLDFNSSFSGLFSILGKKTGDKTSHNKLHRNQRSLSFNIFLNLFSDDENTRDRYFELCVNYIMILVSAREDERTVIIEALNDFISEYPAIHFTPCISGQKPLSLLVNILGAKSPDLSRRLEAWTRGVKGSLFDVETNSVKSAHYMYFDITKEEIEDEKIRQALFFLMLERFLDEINNPENRPRLKIVLIDEYHLFMEYEPIRKICIELLRTGRSKNVQFITISQELSDNFGASNRLSPLDGAQDNFTQHFVFPGDKSAPAILRDMGLPESVIASYNGIYADFNFLYVSPAGYKILSAPTCRHLYWVATTNAAEQFLRDRMIESLGDVELAIDTCVNLEQQANGSRESLIRLMKDETGYTGEISV